MVGIVEGLHVMKFDYFMQDEALARSTWPLLRGERVVSFLLPTTWLHSGRGDCPTGRPTDDSPAPPLSVAVVVRGPPFPGHSESPN